MGISRGLGPIDCLVAAAAYILILGDDSRQEDVGT